jgi:CDP-glucose 4,6-dehydratase
VAAVLITTDKCYENREWLHAYRESDPMGGHDPYSASKGACELAIGSYRRSFFGAGASVALAPARAGNVLGPGDWAMDRIVPDAVRAWSRGQSLAVRCPQATRPWQHVLEPLSGYLQLAVALAEARQRNDEARLTQLGSGINFGPTLPSNRPVAELINGLSKHWPGAVRWEDASRPNDHHEAGLLNLTIDKAYHTLRWLPVWGFEATLTHVARGYATLVENPTRARQVVEVDLEDYQQDARTAGVLWAQPDSH